MATIFTYLLIDIGIYFVAALYLDAVMPRQFGVVRHPLFFLGPITKLFRRGEPEAQPPDPNEDEDVKAERDAVEQSSSSEALPIKTIHLRKMYDKVRDRESQLAPLAILQMKAGHH